jgi:hypothetical protein
MKMRLCALGLIFCLAGCGKDIYPVSGKIVYKDGGVPGKELKDYIVIFQPVGDRSMGAHGLVGEDGRFIVGTEHDNDGAQAGKYQVAIAPPISANADAIRARSVLLERYEDSAKSGLEVTVEPRRNEITLEVERRARK